VSLIRHSPFVVASSAYYRPYPDQPLINYRNCLIYFHHNALSLRLVIEVEFTASVMARAGPSNLQVATNR
jgi:hypothetical protein